jgi:hypothetical protein
MNLVEFANQVKSEHACDTTHELTVLTGKLESLNYDCILKIPLNSTSE